ncbi:MAG: hypothetical protein ABW252_11145 [Polyangiales bacterium]
MSVRRKSSAHVTLVLAGAAALAGCGRDASGSGKRYASKAECVADWGSEEDCKEQASTGSNGHVGHSWMYFGRPGLFHGVTSAFRSGGGSSVSGTSPSTTAPAARSVSRGGFGSTGHAGASS